jgi:transcriptional regulator with XRE-family HTH domain
MLGMDKIMTPARVLWIRTTLNMTQSELAEELGLRHKSQVCRIEDGTTHLRGPLLVALQAIEARAVAREARLASRSRADLKLAASFERPETPDAAANRS